MILTQSAFYIFYEHVGKYIYNIQYSIHMCMYISSLHVQNSVFNVNKGIWRDPFRPIFSPKLC